MTERRFVHAASSPGAPQRWHIRDGRLSVVDVDGDDIETTLDVPVCSADRPCIGCFPVARAPGDALFVLPVLFVRPWPSGGGTLRPVACPIGDYRIDEHLVLEHPDAAAEAELERL